MPANYVAMEGSDGGALATPGGGVGSCGVDVRPPSDSENFKTKSPRRISPRGLCYFCDGGVMPVICPTCQSVFESSTNCRQFDETVSTNCNGFGRLSCELKGPPPFPVRAVRYLR
jgi:hypothetical protein